MDVEVETARMNANEPMAATMACRAYDMRAIVA
jgi:hypothetical protein